MVKREEREREERRGGEREHEKDELEQEKHVGREKDERERETRERERKRDPRDSTGPVTTLVRRPLFDRRERTMELCHAKPINPRAFPHADAEGRRDNGFRGQRAQCQKYQNERIEIRREIEERR